MVEGRWVAVVEGWGVRGCGRVGHWQRGWAVVVGVAPVSELEMSTVGGLEV